MDPISAVGLSASIIQLTRAFAQIVQYVNDVVEAPKELLDFAQEASHLLSLLCRLRNRVQDAHGQTGPWADSVAALGGRDGILEQLKGALTRVADKLAGARKFGKRMLWPLYKKDILATFAGMERLKTLINLALQDNVNLMVRAITSNTANLPALSQVVSSIKASIEEQASQAEVDQSRRIVEWLSPLNFSAAHMETLQKREQGTATWILEDKRFKEWFIADGGVLCCEGIPGSGKTILTSVVTDHIQRLFSGAEDVRVACIYCRHNEIDSQRPTEMIASLWRQVIDLKRPLSRHVRELCTMNQNQGTRPTLDSVFALLQAEVKHRSKVYIIVDALDEYSAEEGFRHTLIEKLGELRPKPNLMITSRNFEDDLAAQYNSHGIKIGAKEQDLNKYITGRIQREERLRRHMRRDTGLTALISRTIIDRAKDMFLMATLHMDSLVHKSNPRAVRTALEQLPAGLQETYQKVLQRIDSQHTDDRDMTNSVLSWVCYAKRPLTIRELQHVLSLDLDNLDFDPQSVTEQDVLLSVCAGLVTVDADSGIVRMVHYTAQEFFEKFRSDRFCDAQQTIVTNCLQYLSFDTLNGYCQNLEDVENRLHSHPFLAYAAEFWGHHLRGHLESVMSDQVFEFFAKKEKISCASQILLLLVCGWETKPTSSVKKASALNLAAYFGLDHIVTLLLEKSAIVTGKTAKSIYLDSHDQNYGTALHWAALGNNASTLNALLAEEGTESLINEANCWTNTAIFEAVRNSRPQAIRALLQRGADASIRGNAFTLTPLHEASIHGRADDIRVLLDSNNKQQMLRQQAHEGPTALHFSVTRNHYEASKVLLDNGASIFAQDMYSKTPLHTAAEHGASKTARLLLDRDSSMQHLSVQSQARKTAFQSACMLGYTEVASLFLRTEIIAQLLQSQPDTIDVTLRSAAAKGQASMVGLLLQYSTRPLPVDSSMVTLLHTAVVSGNIETVRLLVNSNECKGMISAATAMGSTPIHEAARRGFAEIVKFLACEGADLDAKDKQGQTALHCAAEKDLDTVVAVLLLANADSEVSDNKGSNPLRIALNTRSSNVAGLLLEKGASRLPLKDLEDPALRVWAQRQPWWPFFEGTINLYRVPYMPTAAKDVFHAYFCLQKTPLSLLPESSIIIRKILEMAQYWIISKAIHAEMLDFTMHDGDFIYLRSRPIVGRAVCPVRKIVSTTTSKDQGWSDSPGKGTYAGSFTWFDIGHQRVGAQVKTLNLATNIHAGKTLKTHTMIWTENGRVNERNDLLVHTGRRHHFDVADWIRELRPGDRIVIVPKALYQGWTNKVARVELTVYTSCLLPDVKQYKRITSGADVTPEQGTLPLRRKYKGGFYFWGASSAGFDNDNPNIWTPEINRKIDYPKSEA